MNKQDYHHDYNLEIEPRQEKKRWTIRNIKDNCIINNLTK